MGGNLIKSSCTGQRTLIGSLSVPPLNVTLAPECDPGAGVAFKGGKVLLSPAFECDPGAGVAFKGGKVLLLNVAPASRTSSPANVWGHGATFKGGKSTKTMPKTLRELKVRDPCYVVPAFDAAAKLGFVVFIGRRWIAVRCAGSTSRHDIDDGRDDTDRGAKSVLRTVEQQQQHERCAVKILGLRKLTEDFTWREKLSETQLDCLLAVLEPHPE